MPFLWAPHPFYSESSNPISDMTLPAVCARPPSSNCRPWRKVKEEKASFFVLKKTLKIKRFLRRSRVAAVPNLVDRLDTYSIMLSLFWNTVLHRVTEVSLLGPISLPSFPRVQFSSRTNFGWVLFGYSLSQSSSLFKTCTEIRAILWEPPTLSASQEREGGRKRRCSFRKLS